MPVSPAHFRHTMSHLATGVTVALVKDAAGAWHGMTASAVSSVSLEPPMILVCVGYDATIHDLIVAAPSFGLAVLGAGQAAQSERFADRRRHQVTEQLPTSPGGVPLLGGIAHLEVRRAEVFKGGDHSIVTGVVEWSDTPGGTPLVYFRSGYHGLGE